jgi:hypothetical protein
MLLKRLKIAVVHTVSSVLESNVLNINTNCFHTIDAVEGEYA